MVPPSAFELLTATRLRDDGAMATYLDAILEHHRSRAEADSRRLEPLIDTAESCGPVRPFSAAIVESSTLAVVAEIKRRSPSKGDLAADLDPAELAATYERGGAVCLSVLTDEPHFGGSTSDLKSAREGSTLPVLRKDFTVDARDICDARLMGADCVLLIVAALDDSQLADFLALAQRLKIDALVETHDEAEVERAVRCGANLVGVNQRDLVTFEVDQDRAVRVAASIPDDVVTVAESGVRGRADAVALAEAGFDAILVGESVVTASDPERSVGDLRVARDRNRLR